MNSTQPEKYKTSRQITGQTLRYLGLCQDFFDTIPKEQIDKINIIKIKILCSQKIVNQMKRQVTD